MVSKTMDNHVFLALIHCIICTTSFDLWMYHASYDIFAMVISFIDFTWQCVHIIVGLFETQNISGANIVEQVKSLLGSFGLLDKVIAYVKDEGNNLASFIIALTSIISCSTLKLVFPFIGSCFGHAMSKATQYAIDDTRVCAHMMEVSLKQAQATLQKTMTWVKKNVKGLHEWKDVCHLAGFLTKILKTSTKTRFASHVILVQETFQYQDAISICYGHQVASHLSS
jgi:hypothetical protein